MKKPEFSLLQEVLFHKNFDYNPKIELGIHPNIKRKLIGKEELTLSDEVDFMVKYGYDFIKIQPELNFNFGGIKSENTDRTWAPESSGMLATLEDIQNYNFPLPDEISYRRFTDAINLLPKGMKIIGQYGDIFTLAWELLGFENFAVAFYTDKELIRKIMDKISFTVLSMYKKMIEFDEVGAIWYSDDIAYSNGLMLNPEFFYEFFFPILKQIGSLANSRGIPFIYHSDGDLTSVLVNLKECKVDAIHPLEPKAMNIIEIGNKYKEDFCMCGGIDLDILSRSEEVKITEMINNLKEKIKGNFAWCSGSSNSIPEYVPVQNYLRMLSLT